MKKEFRSWGISKKNASITPVFSAVDALPASSSSTLPFGYGRSYGDACLNTNGTLLDTAALNHFLAFDPEQRTVTVEAGLTLGQILEFLIPRGWFLPVIPGTKHVSVGGAIANDVHGKNQSIDGTFGMHVVEFQLSRSTGERLTCSPTKNTELFRATISGLGLTGLITSATLRIQPLKRSSIQAVHTKCDTWEECLKNMKELHKTHEYIAAWLDLLPRSTRFGRSIITAGNHHEEPGERTADWQERISIPQWSPRLTYTPFIKLYNRLHDWQIHEGEEEMSLDAFFFPLDWIGYWNHLYGKKGLVQYQCVFPEDAAETIFETLRTAPIRPYISVLKLYGDKPSPGILSFPRKGWCIALDYPHNGSETIAFIQSLDTLVHAAGGTIYPAKDCCTLPHHFKQGFPQWQEFLQYKDPALSSDFWQRVTAS